MMRASSAAAIVSPNRRLLSAEALRDRPRRASRTRLSCALECFESRLNLLVAGHAATIRFVDRLQLLWRRTVPAAPARFDVARSLGKLLLILLRPGAHTLQYSVDLFSCHDATIANLPDVNTPEMWDDVGRRSWGRH